MGYKRGKNIGHSDTFVFVHVNSFWKIIYFSVGLVLVDCFILGFGCCFRAFFNVMLLSNLLKVSMVKPGVC